MKKILAYWSKLPFWVRNRYFATGLVFAIWMLFIDEHDMISQMELKSELRDLVKTKDYYDEQIEVTKKDLEELLTNNDNLERFAREKYLMKKPNEDILEEWRNMNSNRKIFIQKYIFCDTHNPGKKVSNYIHSLMNKNE